MISYVRWFAVHAQKNLAMQTWMCSFDLAKLWVI